MPKPMRQGWLLAKQSIAVLRANKGLILFPAIAAIASLGIFLLMIQPFWTMERNAFAAFHAHQPIHQNPLAYLLFIMYFFIANLIMTFANCALIASARDYYEGRPVSLKKGLALAWKHIFSIFLWTVMNSTIGIVVRIIEYWTEKWETIPIVLSLLAGISWLMATYFVIPVLVFEKTDPFSAIQRSSYLMRETWGQSIATNFGVNLTLVLLRIASFIPILIGALTGHTNALLTGAIITVSLLLLISILNSAIVMLLKGVLYEFAVKKQVQHFDATSLKNAFQRKKTVS